MNQEQRQRIQELCLKHQDRAQRFLQKIVAANTSVDEHGRYGREINGQQILADRLKRMGAALDIFEPTEEMLKGFPEAVNGHCFSGRPNVVAVFPGKGDGRSLILNGHIDTVPLGDPTTWISPPLDPQIRNGRLYGRGACDMKAGLCGFVEALDILQEAGIELSGNVIVQSVVDEEGGGAGTMACCAKGYRADAAIVGEPTSLTPAPAHMGWMFIRITFPGRSTHSSTKWSGVNAIELACQFIAFAHELEREWVERRHHPYLPAPFFNIGTIYGGGTASIVPSSCAVELSVRFLPGDEILDGWTGGKTEAAFRQAIWDFCQGIPFLRENPPLVEVFQRGGAFDIGLLHPVLRLTQQTIFERTGQEVFAQGLPCGTDARLLATYAATPALLYGPGNIADAHTANESVALSEYCDYIQDLCFIIEGWCNGRTMS